jgi:hypothetical protein
MTPEAASFFRAMDRRLGQEQRLHLVGEGALVLAYGAERSSCALDVLPGEAPAWALAGSALERAHGFCLRPAAATSLPPDWRTRCRQESCAGLRRLTLWAPSREDLLLGKLSPFSDADRQDIDFLAAGAVDRLELIRRFRALRRQHRGDLRILDRSFNYVLKEHFNLGPFRF